MLVDKPPPNVTQYFFDLFSPTAAPHVVDDLDTMADFIVNGKLKVFVDKTFAFDDAVDGCVVSQSEGCALVWSVTDDTP